MPEAEKQSPVCKKSKVEICNQEKVKEAINALKLLNKKFIEEDLKKQPLLEDVAESPIYLQVTLKKIPPPQLIKMIKVTLPHSLLTETSEVCLFTGDLDKHDNKAEIEPTVLYYKDLLKKHGVTKVNQVFPLRQLRTEYKTFETRRQLCAAYDVFLVDRKISGVLPKTLGKSFFHSRKFPFQIDMKSKNLKDQIDKALCKTEFSLTCRGNSYGFGVARLSMEDNAIVENLMTSIEVLAKELPGNEKNIMSLYVKTAKSKAIPIFVSLDASDDVLIKKPRKSEKFKLGELSTMDDSEVKVFRDGRVIVRETKKGSAKKHENTAENETLTDLTKSEEDTQKSIDHEVSLKKKKKGRKISDTIKATNKSSPMQKKKSIGLDEVDVSLVENEEILDSITTKISPQKKKGRKSTGLNEVADIPLIKTVQVENSFTSGVSPKKKVGKKSTGVDEVMEVETSIMYIQDQKTPLRSKEGGKKITQSATKRKLSNVDSAVKNSSEKKKRRKSGRKSIIVN